MNTRGVARKSSNAARRRGVDAQLCQRPGRIYQGEVHCRHEGLKLMDIMTPSATRRRQPEAIKAREKPSARPATSDQTRTARRKEEPVEVPRTLRCRGRHQVQRHVLGFADLAWPACLLDERALFLGQWGFARPRGGGYPTDRRDVLVEPAPPTGILAHAAVGCTSRR